MLKVSSNEVITFEATTLEEVYEKASESLNCSITNLDIVLLQAPSKGFLGFFPKNAIITAQVKSSNIEEETFPNKNIKINATVETLSSRLNALNEEENKKLKKIIPKMSKQVQKEKLFDDFYTSNEKEVHFSPIIKTANKDLLNEISLGVNNLFSLLCYDIDEIKVDIIDDETVYIEFAGVDSALLIGKEGYRYKALSYILFNWINEKYNMMLRLEVAQFLANQEIAIFAYLDPLIETIKKDGYCKTKILDGVLVHIALSKLRDEFPDKYVAVKTTQRGEKYILVNEYRN